MREQLGEVMAYAQAMLRAQEGETLVILAPPFKTTTAGKGSGTVWNVPTGFTAFLLRASVDYNGSSAKTGGHKCDVRICADSIAASNLRAVASVLPNVYEAGRSHAPLFRGGQGVVVQVQTTGPHTTTIFVTLQVLIVKRQTAHLDVVASIP